MSENSVVYEQSSTPRLLTRYSAPDTCSLPSPPSSLDCQTSLTSLTPYRWPNKSESLKEEATTVGGRAEGRGAGTRETRRAVGPVADAESATHPQECGTPEGFTHFATTDGANVGG
jgi:hypothetical protein